MAGHAQLLDVLIASPGDSGRGRDAIEQALHEWNTHRSDSTRFVLRPLRWETGSVPILGRGDGQSIINTQLVDKSDIVFAIFYNKVGSATPRAVSGTVEEIRRSVNAGKLVHLYFADMSRPSNVDPKQLLLLAKLRSELQGEGLVGTFRTEEELQRHVANAIERDLTEIQNRQKFGDADERPPPDVSDPVTTEEAFSTPYEPVPQLDSTDAVRTISGSAADKVRAWSIIALLSGTVFIALLSATPSAPDRAPAWIAVPGVFSLALLIIAVVRLIILKIRSRQRSL